MKFELTWFEARKCWKKFRNGKMYYLGQGKCSGKYDYEGYKAALEEWKQKEGELDQTEKKQRLETELFETDPEKLKAIMMEVQNRAWHEEHAKAPTYEEQQQIDTAMETHRRVAAATPTNRTVQHLVDAFIKAKMAQVTAKQKSAGRLKNIRSYLKKFEEFLGPQNSVDLITAVTLSEYHSKLLESIGLDQISNYAARDHLQIVKQFIKWLWNLGAIETMPKNVSSKDLEIQVSAQKIEPWDFEVLKNVLAAAPEPLRLYLLLMANCGMTQIDVSDLLNSQVDWENGIITRKRSKTHKHENVPTVSYKLWKPTIDLLKKHRNPNTPTALSTPSGTPLVYDTMSAKGKGSKRDSIAIMFNAWIVQAKIKNYKGIGDIRKTSSTKLGEHPTFVRYAQYFLCQSPKSVADKFYVVPSQAQFDKAVTWLGKQYGI